MASPTGKFKPKHDVRAAILSILRKNDTLKKRVVYSIERSEIREQNTKFQTKSGGVETSRAKEPTVTTEIPMDTASTDSAATPKAAQDAPSPETPSTGNSEKKAS